MTGVATRPRHRQLRSGHVPERLPLPSLEARCSEMGSYWSLLVTGGSTAAQTLFLRAPTSVVYPGEASLLFVGSTCDPLRWRHSSRCLNKTDRQDLHGRWQKDMSGYLSLKFSLPVRHVRDGAGTEGVTAAAVPWVTGGAPSSPGSAPPLRPSAAPGAARGVPGSWGSPWAAAVRVPVTRSGRRWAEIRQDEGTIWPRCCRLKEPPCPVLCCVSLVAARPLTLSTCGARWAELLRFLGCLHVLENGSTCCRSWSGSSAA